MCNLYSVTTNQQAIRDLVRFTRDMVGNLPAIPAVFPDKMAPTARIAPDGVRELVMMRWGFPQKDPQPGEKKRTGYVTNVRHPTWHYWKAWMQPENRCLVPVTRFCEPDNRGEKSVPTWFAQDETRPLFCFAGIWRPWAGHRGTKANPADGGSPAIFLPYHHTQHCGGPGSSKGHACVAFGRSGEGNVAERAGGSRLALQSPAPDGALRVIAMGQKQDGL